MYGPTQADLWAFVIIFALFGAAAFKGCELGCSYVARHVEFQWK